MLSMRLGIAQPRSDRIAGRRFISLGQPSRLLRLQRPLDGLLDELKSLLIIGRGNFFAHSIVQTVDRRGF
jgi:hypothetical protein